MPLTETVVQRLRTLLPTRRHFFLAAGALVVLTMLVAVTSRRLAPSRQHTKAGWATPALPAIEKPFDSPVEAPSTPTRTTVVPFNESVDHDLRFQAPVPSQGGVFEPARAISYSAELGIASKDFTHARSAMEEVLDRHNGYTARLRMTGLPAGSTLSATLRVPVSEYPSALAELKSIGTVERDEEAADEIAEQHGDIAARLRNAQNAEHRFEEMLKNNDGKASPFFIQQQLNQVRAEIARLEAERRAFDSRTALSNIYVTLREERVTPAESFAGQLRAAAVSGFSDVLGTLSAILLLCMNYGPSLLLWAALLFYPFRLLWRRAQGVPARSAA
jgi:hypothetical protein